MVGPPLVVARACEALPFQPLFSYPKKNSKNTDVHKSVSTDITKFFFFFFHMPTFFGRENQMNE